MVDFARENVRLFCILPAFGNICDGADDARCPLPMLSATKICKPVNLDPADPKPLAIVCRAQREDDR